MRKLWLAILAAAACGSPEHVSSVRAWREGGAVRVRYAGSAVRVATASFALGEEVSAASGAVTQLPDDPRADAVWVTRQDGAKDVGFISEGAEGGSASAWQLFAPGDFRAGELHADFPTLGAGERLAVLLVNAGAADGASAEVAVTGTANPAAPAMPSLQNAENALVAARSPDQHEALRLAQARDSLGPAAAVEAAPAGDHRAFCVVRGLDFSHHLRKGATRVVASASADFFVDDEDLPHYDAGFVPQLAQAWEAHALPAVSSAFGPPTDVDANGKVIVLLTHELGAHLNGGWLIGYFGNADLLRARDESCGDTGSNHGEIIYLNDVANGEANGYTAAELGSTIFPATLAHELQHLVNLGQRCVLRRCGGGEDTWINEAMSKVAEDLAGYGWSSGEGRGEGAMYLSRATGALRGYDGRSLTLWEGDPIGNYQGAHSFLRFFADRLGPQLSQRLIGGAGGVAALEGALQRPLPRAMAEWATALLLSNEQGAPFSFSGADWSPLHARLRHLDYVPLPGSAEAVLRTDGIAAFVTGAGQGAPARVVVRSGQQVPPHVVVVRFSGSLPR